MVRALAHLSAAGSRLLDWILPPPSRETAAALESTPVHVIVMVSARSIGLMSRSTRVSERERAVRDREDPCVLRACCKHHSRDRQPGRWRTQREGM